jgi:ferredoxin
MLTCYLASLESVDKKISALKEELKADFITSESLQALNDKVDKLSAEIMQVIGHRLTSLSLIPTEITKCIKCCACVKECPNGARVFDTPYTPMLHQKCAARREPELFI